MCVIFARPKSEKCLSNGRKKLTETLATQAIICISRDLRVWGGGETSPLVKSQGGRDTRLLKSGEKALKRGFCLANFFVKIKVISFPIS